MYGDDDDWKSIFIRPSQDHSSENWVTKTSSIQIEFMECQHCAKHYMEKKKKEPTQLAAPTHLKSLQDFSTSLNTGPVSGLDMYFTSTCDTNWPFGH
jgi:hypothetical protein